MWLAAGRLEAAGEALDLDVEGLVAVLVEVAARGSARRGSGGSAGSARRRRSAGGARSRCAGTAGPGGEVAGGVVEGLHPHPLAGRAWRSTWRVGEQKLGLGREALRLGDEVAELVDHPLPVPGEVGGALAGAGRRVDVGGDRARRLRAAEQVALVGLADGDVRGREVGEDRRAGERALGRGRGRGPEVLAESRRAARSRRGRRRRRSGRGRTAPRCRRPGSSRRRCRGRAANQRFS